MRPEPTGAQANDAAAPAPALAGAPAPGAAAVPANVPLGAALPDRALILQWVDAVRLTSLLFNHNISNIDSF